MLIPNSVLRGATFLGVMAHEFAHELMCRLTNTKVIGGHFFQIQDSSGCVVSEQPSSIWKCFSIGFCPFIFNTLLGFIAGLIAAASYRAAGKFEFMSIAFCYVSLSVAFNAFPSLQDAKVIDGELWKKGTSILAKVLLAPFVFIFAVKAVIGTVFMDFIWSLAFGVIIPFRLLGIK